MTAEPRRDLASDEDMADRDLSAPEIRPGVSLLEAQPVRVAGAAQAVVAAAAVILAFGAPWWGALLLAVGLYVFEEWKAARVTPVADPKLDQDIRLVPDA